MNKKIALVFLSLLGMISFSFAQDTADNTGTTNTGDSTTINAGNENTTTGDMQTPPPPPTTSGDNQTPPPPASDGSIQLKTRITQVYKVEAMWTPIAVASGEELANYVLLISQTNTSPSLPAGDGVKSVSIKPKETHVADWNSKKGNNYYVVCAVMYSGKSVCSNVSTVVMGPNGEPAYGTNPGTGDNHRYDRPYTGNYQGYTGDHRTMSGDHQGYTGDNHRYDRPYTGNYQGYTGDHRPMSGDHQGIQNIAKKIYISESLRKSIIKKLDAIPKENKKEFFQKIINKIDKRIEEIKTNTSMDKSKKYFVYGVLTELKEIIKNRLNALSENSDANEIINSVLETTTSSS